MINFLGLFNLKYFWKKKHYLSKSISSSVITSKSLKVLDDKDITSISCSLGSSPCSTILELRNSSLSIISIKSIKK